MRKSQIRFAPLHDLTILEIIEIGSTLFFTSLLLFSAYLMSCYSFKQGFLSLALACIYFIANNTAKFKLLRASVWIVILGFSLKGLMGL